MLLIRYILIKRRAIKLVEFELDLQLVLMLLNLLHLN